MSSIGLLRYPVLTKTLRDKIGYTLGNLKFSYKDRYGKHQLLGESLQGATASATLVQLADSQQNWHPDTDGLDIQLSAEIANPLFLFGKNGLLFAPDSQLGIGLIWKDREARIRGSQKIALLKPGKTDEAEFWTELHFEPGMLRGRLSLQIVLYAEKPGTGSLTPSGAVLGVLDDMQIVIEGSGSVFPITEVEEPGEPLWWVETSIEDPGTDRFDASYLALNLNRAHPKYEDLHLSDDEESFLFKEILASAIFTLVMQVLGHEDGKEAIRNRDEAESGSVASILNYMGVTGKWIGLLDQPDKLSGAIHKWIDREF